MNGLQWIVLHECLLFFIRFFYSFSIHYLSFVCFFSFFFFLCVRDVAGLCGLRFGEVFHNFRDPITQRYGSFPFFLSLWIIPKYGYVLRPLFSPLFKCYLPCLSLIHSPCHTSLYLIIIFFRWLLFSGFWLSMHLGVSTSIPYWEIPSTRLLRWGSSWRC